MSVLQNGRLVFHSFHAENSGEYHCSTMYRQEGTEYIKKYSFLLYGFHKPDWSMSIGVDFISHGCNQQANNQVIKFVISHLQLSLIQIGWKVLEKIITCHWLKSPKEITPDSSKVIVHFDLIAFPYGLLWEQHCPTSDSKMRKDCDKMAEEQLRKHSGVGGPCKFFSDVCPQESEARHSAYFGTIYVDREGLIPSSFINKIDYELLGLVCIQGKIVLQAPYGDFVDLLSINPLVTV
ncbi:zona pellucida-binding protein 2-like [Polypterus senegalus]|uniref:zona pellucida-binding protein 2-like n=1 Tax=Polypterus senegalus TaxID=55291 RepID=UPI001963904D|nr:zona pellucida-binding protein 2-like [Polypterus senegalus]